jgi:hypothetical protein
MGELESAKNSNPDKKESSIDAQISKLRFKKDKIINASKYLQKNSPELRSIPKLSELKNKNPEWFKAAEKAFNYFKIPLEHLYVLFATIYKETGDFKNKIVGDAVGIAQSRPKRWSEFVTELKNNPDLSGKSYLNPSKINRKMEIPSIWFLAWNMSETRKRYSKSIENGGLNLDLFELTDLDTSSAQKIAKYYYIAHLKGIPGALNWFKKHNIDDFERTQLKNSVVLYYNELKNKVFVSNKD